MCRALRCTELENARTMADAPPTVASAATAAIANAATTIRRFVERRLFGPRDARFGSVAPSDVNALDLISAHRSLSFLRMSGLGEPALLVLLVTPNASGEAGCRAKGWSRLAFWTL